MKLEKFNLQDALNGRPVVTRDGRFVKIAGYNPDAYNMYKLCGWTGTVAMSWDENGNYFDDQSTSVDDIFHPVEEKQPRTFWVNEHKVTSKSSRFGKFHETEEEAMVVGRMSANYITTHKITIP